MAAMMAHLVKDGALQQIGSSHRLVTVQTPLHLLPGQPIADLRIRREQQHFAAGRELDRQYKARVVGRRIEV